MADLDELERLSQARPTDGPAVLEYLAALYLSAPALLAAARAAQHRGETLERVAEAVGYPRGAHYGDVLGRIDELVAERDRLRAAVDGVLAEGEPYVSESRDCDCAVSALRAALRAWEERER